MDISIALGGLPGSSNVGNFFIRYDFTPVPEPSAALLLGLALVAVGIVRRKLI